jgi:hypothetical protein
MTDEDISVDEKETKGQKAKEAASAAFERVRPEVTGLAGAALAQGLRAAFTWALTPKRKKVGDRHE